MMDSQIPPLVLASYDQRYTAGNDIRDHMPYLRTRAASLGPGGVIAEFGVRRGNSTCAFLAGAIASGAQVWSVDLDRSPDLDWFSGTGQWQFLQADALGQEAAGWVPGQIDVLFVDLDPHTLLQTEEMLSVWLPRVRPGGLALWHDTSWGGGTGVRDALDGWAKETGLSWEERPGSNGLGVIQL
jgi:predicted O-methyltransferase YrrM